MPLPEIIVELSSKPSALDFRLETGDLSKKPSFIEIIAAASENTRGVAPTILTSRKNVESVAGDESGKFKLKPITVVLDEDFGLKLANKYCVKIALYDDNRSKLAESPKVITTLAEAPAAPVITAARSKELGEAELSLRLGKWSGADIRSARVCLFKDVEASELDDITLLDIATTIAQHATGAAFVLDLAPHVVLDPDTDYIAKVAFESPIGLGPFSEAFSFKPVDVPDKVLAPVLEHLHEENTLRLQWKAGSDSKQYGENLKFQVEMKLAPFEGSAEEITFASAQISPLKVLKSMQDPDAVPVFETDLVKPNEFKASITADTMSQLVAQYPDRKISRKLKFSARIVSSDGRNSSLPVATNMVTVIRATGTGSVSAYEELFVVTASGSQTRKFSPERIEKEVSVDVKLRPDVTYAQVRELLREPATQIIGSPVVQYPPWATKLEYKVSLVQTNDAKVDAVKVIDFSQEPSVVSATLSTLVAFAKSDKVSISYWLKDADGNKSESFIYSKSIKLPVAALVYRASEGFSVNAGKVSAEVFAFVGTETDLISARLLSRPFVRTSPAQDAYTETTDLSLMPTDVPNKFQISYSPSLSGINATETLGLKLKVSESKSSVLSAVFIDPSDIKTVVSNIDLSSIVDEVSISAFDGTISPSQPSSYKVLLSIAKSVATDKLKVYNNVMVDGVDPKVSVAGKVLTIFDKNDIENEIKVTLSSTKLQSLEAPSPTDPAFIQDLSVLNKSSLKDTHLFVYLKFSDLAPSEFNVNAKATRLIDGQEYSAIKDKAVKLRDDFGFAGEYQFSDRALAIRINRNGNLEEDGSLNIWGIPKDGNGTSDGPIRVNAVLRPSVFLKRNQVEDWALIDLTQSGAMSPLPLEALLVVMGTGGRNTSFTFKVLDQKGDGSIITDLSQRQLLTAGATP